MTPEKNITFVTQGFITSKNNLIFDFSYLPVKNIIMFIISNN